MTGRIDATIRSVSSQEMMKRKTKATIMNRKERMNMETLVERPSWMTAVSEPMRDTKIKC